MVKWRKKQIRNNKIKKPQNESMRKHKLTLKTKEIFIFYHLEDCWDKTYFKIEKCTSMHQWDFLYVGDWNSKVPCELNSSFFYQRFIRKWYIEGTKPFANGSLCDQNHLKINKWWLFCVFSYDSIVYFTKKTLILHLQNVSNNRFPWGI